MKGVSWKSWWMCAALTAGTWAGCEARSEPEAAPAATRPDDDEAPGGLGLPPMAEMFAKNLQKPGRYEAPRHSPDFDAGQDHFVTITLDSPLSELRAYDWFSPAGTTPMRSFQKRLREAAANEHVRGIVLRTSRVGLPMSVAQDLREALVEFKGDGKRTVACHTEAVSNGTYYALTACDRLGLAPLGDVMVSGPAASPVHVRGLLDRVGVQADFIHIGDFKGAAEPLTRDAPSEEMKQTLVAILDQSYETLVAGIAGRPGLDDARARAAIDTAMFTGQAAKEAGLVDDVATYEAFRDAVVAGAGWTEPSDGTANPLQQLIELQRFLGMMPTQTPSEPHVALVYAVGEIVDGDGGGMLGARQQIASHTLVAALRALTDDPAVTAVVMRVDSPGGSALASEQIWAAAQALAERKPLVVSMGSVAASGGYYISSPARKIFARDNTLTGSIGVVGGKMVVGQALADVGVTTHEMGRGARASMWSSMRPWTEEERASVQTMMESVYETFLSRVGQGRRMERDAVHAVAQGRVWTGVAARERGLVDALGGLDDALAAAAEMGGVSLEAGLQVYPPEPTLRDFLQGFGGSPLAAAGTVGARLDAILAAAAVPSLVAPDELRAVIAVLRRALLLQSARIWAVAWVEPPR